MIGWGAMTQVEAEAVCDGAVLVQQIGVPDKVRWFTCKGAGAGDDAWCNKCAASEKNKNKEGWK